MQEPSFGFSHLWANGDALAHTVAIVLLAMSIASWYLMIVKLMDWRRFRRDGERVEAFWHARTFAEGLQRLGDADTDPYAALATQARICHDHCAALQDSTAHRELAARLDPSEQLERGLRQNLGRTQSRLENGLTLLATTGATAPFVGLFGTVWGIYHALVAIGLSGQAALEKVAGPVGEALIMTAAGLAVALPAVFAYNAVTRANRVLLADLDAFAHDLHAYFTVGRQPATSRRNVMPAMTEAA